MRASDDLGRSAAWASETALLLKDQCEAPAGKEPEIWSRERAAVSDWYQKYADWIKRMSAEVDADAAEIFSGSNSGAWVDRYEEIANGYRDLGAQLGNSMRSQENEKRKIETRLQKLETAIREGRILVEKEDLDLGKELLPGSSRYTVSDVLYRDLTDEESGQFSHELKRLVDHRTFYEVLLELEQYEVHWLNARADEASELFMLAGVIEDSTNRAIRQATRSTIRLFETDASAFTRKTDQLIRSSNRITRTGSLTMLDLLAEQSRYYEEMKVRYENHTEWLKGRIGDYRADLVELSREP